MSISTMIMMFCISFNLSNTQPRVEFTNYLRVIDTPYGKRQAHAVAKLRDNTITIRLGHWNRINVLQQQELLWHELAHLRGCNHHVDTEEHIMNPHAPHVYWVKPDGSNWSDLTKKLGNYLRDCLNEP